MDWITDHIKSGFWSAIADLVTSAIKEVMGWIIDMMINLSDINKYLNTNDYLPYIYSIALGLLLVKIAQQAVQYQAGLTNEKPLSEMIMRTIAAATGIYFLPWFLTNVIIIINNTLLKLINSVGQEVTPEAVKQAVSSWMNFGSSPAGWTVVLGLIFAIAWIIMGIMAGKRYVELLFALFIAPITSTTIIKGNEGVQTWMNQVISIVFTQSVHLFLLKLLIIFAINTTGLYCIVLTVGTVWVAITGPQMIKDYLYTSGVAGVSSGAVGGAGRMAAMKMMMK